MILLKSLNQYGNFGLALMPPIAIGLAVPPSVITLTVLEKIIGMGIMSLTDSKAINLFCFAVALIALIVLFSKYLVTPIIGGYYSFRIKKEYGTKTLSTVWDLTQSDEANLNFDIDQIAKEHGESKIN